MWDGPGPPGLRYLGERRVPLAARRTVEVPSVRSGRLLWTENGGLLAVGDGIKEGAVLSSASVLDVAPTILYLMGLPVARDMEGRVLTEIVEEAFARAHPVTFIPSYESLAVRPPTAEVPPGLPPLPDERP